MTHAANSSVKVTHGCIEAERLNDSYLWHLRLGHAPIMKLHHLGVIDKSCKRPENFCATCPMGKLTKQPFNLSQSYAAQPFELLHINVWGPYKVQTREGYRFFLTMIDDHSMNTWVTLLKHKNS